MPTKSGLLNRDYVELKQLVMNHGLLESQTPYYIMKALVAVATLAGAAVLAVAASSLWIVLLAALLLGFASTQIGLFGHDVCHRQAFRGRRANKLSRFFFASLLLGISHSWWNTKHNRHHASPNHIDKDPDIQLPMIAFAPAQIAKRHRFWRPVIAVQAFVFIALLPLQALNMRYTSIQHLLGPEGKSRMLQGGLMALHFILYGVLLVLLGDPLTALLFVLVHQATFGVYNSSVFASNHKGMPIIDDSTKLDFLREQVLTSRNVTGHRILDFWYGGLNYQIEHHLFPTMPRNNLRRAQVIVERFCKERGIAYHATGLFASYRESFLQLHRAGASLRS
jgi:fatty acid desaturase